METVPFAIVLASNASFDTFPDNKISNFTVKLAKPVNLEGQWTVAMTEIQYVRTWNTVSNDEAFFHLKKNSLQDAARGNFRGGCFNTIVDLLKPINRTIATMPHYPDTSLYYDEYQRCVILQSPEDTVKFTTHGRLLNIIGTVLQGPEQPDKSKADIYGGSYNFLVYSDIVEHQRVGDSYAPLLRAVQIKGENNAVVNIQYDKPNYVNVCKNHFDTVNVQIRDDQGRFIGFKYGKIWIRLHFTPLRANY